jgi:hypothetical protein
MDGLVFRLFPPIHLSPLVASLEVHFKGCVPKSFFDPNYKARGSINFFVNHGYEKQLVHISLPPKSSIWNKFGTLSICLKVVFFVGFLSMVVF